MEHVWSVLCEKMLQDEDGVPSLITLIEKLIIHQSMEEVEGQLSDAEGVAGFAYPMWLISWCVRSDFEKAESFEMRVGWQSPKGDYTPTGADTFHLVKISGARIRSRIPGIPWRGLGRYWLLVEVRGEGSEDWTIATRIPVEVEIQPPGAPPEQA